MVSGNLNEGISFEYAKQEIWNQLMMMADEKIEEKELIKVKNKFKTSKVFSEQSLMNRVMNIAFFELLDKAELVNDELQKYDTITADEIQHFCKAVFRKENLSTLMITAKK